MDPTPARTEHHGRVVTKAIRLGGSRGRQEATGPPCFNCDRALPSFSHATLNTRVSFREWQCRVDGRKADARCGDKCRVADINGAFTTRTASTCRNCWTGIRRAQTVPEFRWRGRNVHERKFFFSGAKSLAPPTWKTDTSENAHRLQTRSCEGAKRSVQAMATRSSTQSIRHPVNSPPAGGVTVSILNGSRTARDIFFWGKGSQRAAEEVILKNSLRKLCVTRKLRG